MQKKILAINDISCVGRCSLTVALPILSAAGFETAILPTAILSTHTGGFEGYTFCDFTEQIMPIAEHWKSLGLKFDAIYTGYLGSKEQLGLVSEIIDMFRGDNTIVYTDPVMGDNGKLYTGFDGDFPAGMLELCKKADLIVPNITEAAFMTKNEYISEGYDKAYIEKLIADLTETGIPNVVISGVSFEKGKVGAAVYRKKTGKTEYAFTDRIDAYYHGTGDVFASALLAGAAGGLELTQAARKAMEFTYNSILRTHKAGDEERYGVRFEEELADFAKGLK